MWRAEARNAVANMHAVPTAAAPTIPIFIYLILRGARPESVISHAA
jgi:hypothetical protein